MQTNGHNAHHTPNETAALLPSRTSSSSSSSGNDLRESLMASTDSHEPALGTKPAAPSSASPQPTAFTHFPHQQSISKDAYDLSKIRGQGWIGQVLPGPFWIKNIIVTEACERYAYYGLRAVLTLYLNQVLLFSTTQATSLSLYSQALAYFMPILGGYVADTHLGKYTTIMYFSVVYVLGSSILALTSYEAYAWGMYLGLFFIAVGTGGIKPCVSAFGADQFAGEYGRRVSKADVEKEVSSFFHVFYLSINIGSVASFILSPLFRTHIGYWMAFGMPAVFLCIATFVFWSGRADYLKFPPQGSVLTPMVKALRTGYSRRQLTSRPENAGKSWIDMAAGQPGVSAGDVVNAKAFWRLMPFFAVMPAFWMLFDQQSNAWVLQAVRMELHGIQPEQMLLANPVLVVLLIPVMEKYIYPALAARNIQFGEFRRIGVGMLLSVASFLLAAFVQSQIPDDPNLRGPSIFWQLPQYFLISFAEILISITGLEFAYTQAPPALKSTLTACWLVTTGLGNLLAGVLWEALGPRMSVTGLSILFAALMLADAMLFMHVAYTFQHEPSQVGTLETSEEEKKDGGGGVELAHGIDQPFKSAAVNHELAHVAAIEDL